MNEVTVKIHESNLDFFNDKLAELNEMFAKKHLPLISCSMTEEEMYSVDEWTKEKHPYILYTAHITSDFNQANLKGISCNFEGIVSLVEGNENDKIYTFKNISYSSFLTDCKCDECNKKIGRNKYLVFSKTEEVKSREDLIVLGTSCAKNYFPFDIERYFGFLESAFEELGGFDEYDGEYSFGNGNSKYKELFDIYVATCRMTDNLKIYKKEGETKSDVIFIFSDDEGHKFKWSTSCGTYKCWHKTNGKDAFLEYEVGKKYILKGSIKAHEEYKGCKQTVITRCKVLGDGCENHVFNPKDVVKEEVKSDDNHKDPFESLINTMEEVEQSA